MTPVAEARQPGAGAARALDGVARALRRVPNFRGKVNAAWRWQRFLDRGGGLAGRWRVALADGPVLELPWRSSMACAVAVTGHWDPAHVGLARRYIRKDSLVLDVGASLGLWTVQLAQAARSVRAEVWAIEPAPANVGWLEHNIRLNHLDDCVQVRPIALGSAPGTVSVRLIDAAGGNAYIPLGSESGAAVEIFRLDDLPRTRPVSFMKLDVEGFELEVLRGARRVLEEDRPVVFAECSRVWLEQRGEDLGAFLRELAELGYQVLSVTRRRSRPWRAVDGAAARPVDISGRVQAEDLLLLPRG